MVECFAPRNIRVSRVSCDIECPDSIAIERIVRKSGIGITARVRCDLSDLHKVCAAIALAALYEETVLVC